MKNRTLRIGSRDSQLAIRQAELIKKQLEQLDSSLIVELVTMKTTGDRILTQRLDRIGGKGLFVKELDEALRQGEIDLAVHSLKDMPMEIPEDLPIVAFSKREDPRDVLIYQSGVTEQALKQGGIIGSASPRRILQLRQLYPDCEFRTIRGNVQTRLNKLEQEGYQATVLAAAGIHRLQLHSRIGRYFELDEMIPAAGQGILAVQCRKGVNEILLSRLNDKEAQTAAVAERSFVRELGGSCASPIAAYAAKKGEKLILTGLYADSQEDSFIRGSLEGEAEAAEKIGAQLARFLKG